MTQTHLRNSSFEALYGIAIRLYPRWFREEYGTAMCQAVRDALADPALPRLAALRIICIDFFKSLGREHLAMLRDSLTRPALVFNALVLAGISTVLALFLYAIPQQVLRQGADDPQLQLAGDLAVKLEQGVAPADAVPADQVDMAHSLAPFVIVYDDTGVPIASQAQLNGKAPAPPSGVFDHVRQHHDYRFSWQPVRGPDNGVRMAAVVLRVEHLTTGGAGFVLAGRSLVQVEAREAHVKQLAGIAWIAMMGLIAAGTLAFGWFTGRTSAPSAAA